MSSFAAAILIPIAKWVGSMLSMQSEHTYSANAKRGGIYDLMRRHADRGQGLVEYALIILFVAIAVVAAVTLLGPTISSIFNQIPPAL